MLDSPQPIMLISADSSLLQLLRDILADAGYQSIMMYDFSPIYAQVKALLPVMIIIDLGAPHDEYIQKVLDSFYADPQTRKIPVMVLSTMTGIFQSDQLLLRKRGYMPQRMPFVLEEFTRKLQKAIAPVC